VSKKASTFINMFLSLLVITMIAGLTLGYVNDLTLEPKAKAKLERKTNAIKLVLPAFDNNPLEDMIRMKPQGQGDSLEIYPAFNKQQFIGAAVTGYSEKGYSGLVKLLVGFNDKGQIEAIEVLEQKETPGLGTKMKNNSFLSQFKNQHPEQFNLKATKDGGDVDAITGATISTRAFGEAVQMAFDAYVNYLETQNPFKP
jgi:electron transport complex protein RnfG